MYPVSSHFFCITALDRAKTWNPITTAVLDVPTAYAFFGASPKETVSKMEKLVLSLADTWNADQAKKSTVKKFFLVIPLFCVFPTLTKNSTNTKKN